MDGTGRRKIWYHMSSTVFTDKWGPPNRLPSMQCSPVKQRPEMIPDKPQVPPMPMRAASLLLLLPLIAVSAAATRTLTPPYDAAAAGGAPPPVPTPWPEQFHAVMFTNLTESGRLQVIDLYYDWPRGRNLNLIRNQLSGDPVHDVEWTNGTSYIFDSATCRTIRFPVGVLPPNWLDGAVYLGREFTDGFDCHLWTKVDFIWYWEDVVTHRPVRWNFFNGMQQHAMSFEVGGVLEDSKWQAPAHCFTDHAAPAASDGTDGEADTMGSLLRFAGAPAAAVAAA